MNFRKVGFILSMVAMTSFTMTSCAEATEETTTEAEGTHAEEAVEETVEETVVEEVEVIEEVVDTTAVAEPTCGDGHAEEAPAAH
ncbi:MAG: hypothetical protein H6598_07785 [Flavobacteriales bacterium]|nr:hypothetical protein [Flavobacteriales bacterium]